MWIVPTDRPRANVRAIRLTVAYLAALLFLLAPGGTAIRAGFLSPGNFVVADRSSQAILGMDPATGNYTLISTGGNIVEPTGVAVDASGNIYVSDRNAFAGALGGIIKIDPTTGNQVALSAGGLFFHPEKMIIDRAGQLLVANPQGTPIVEVDPMTGAQTAFLPPGSFGVLTAITEASDGTLYATDLTFDSVIRIDPVTKTETIISSGGLFRHPVGIAIDSMGNLLVADPAAGGGQGAILRVNPVTGAQATLSSGGLFAVPDDVAVSQNGDIFVSDENRGIFQIDAATGDQTFLAPYVSGDIDSLAIYASPAVVPEPPGIFLAAISFVCLSFLSLRWRIASLE